MSLKLAHKVLLPFAVLGLIVIAAFVAVHSVNNQLNAANSLERDLLEVHAEVHELGSRVQAGILTRNDVHAVAAAKIALQVEQRLGALSDSHASATALFPAFQQFFVGVVSINALFLENREAEGAKRLDEVHALEDRIGNAIEAMLDELAAERERLAIFARSFMVGAVVVLVALMVLVGLIVSRQVVAPIRRIGDRMSEIARGRGDLTASLEVDSRDEVGAIAEGFNAMIGGLRTTIASTADSARQVADAAGGLASAIQQVQAASQAQGEAASSMAAAVEELTVSVSHVASMSQETEQAAQTTFNASQGGIELASASSDEMQALTASGLRAAELTSQLIEESNRIHGLVGTIHEIADQTNLLALNAAIEAARAGESGRGFAVVADEVRKLAERTNTEATRIRQIVDGMSSVVQSIAQTIRHNTEEEEHESETSKRVRELFTEVGAQAEAAAQRVRDIANAMQEQTAAATDIARNVESVAQMAEENNAAVGSVTESATRLKRLAEGLQQQLAGFRY